MTKFKEILILTVSPGGASGAGLAWVYALVYGGIALAGTALGGFFKNKR